MDLKEGFPLVILLKKYIVRALWKTYMSFYMYFHKKKYKMSLLWYDTYGKTIDSLYCTLVKYGHIYFYEINFSA